MMIAALEWDFNNVWCVNLFDGELIALDIILFLLCHMHPWVIRFFSMRKIDLY